MSNILRVQTSPNIAAHIWRYCKHSTLIQNDACLAEPVPYGSQQNVFQIANDVRTFAIKPLKDNCTSLQALKYFSRVDGVIFKWVSLPWSLTHLKSFLPLGLLRPWLLL